MDNGPADTKGRAGVKRSYSLVGPLFVATLSLGWFHSKPTKRRTIWCLLGWHRPDPDNSFSGRLGGQYKCRVCGTWVVYHD